MTHQIRLDVTVPPELLARLKAAHAAGYAQHPQSFAAFVRGALEYWLKVQSSAGAPWEWHMPTVRQNTEPTEEANR